YVVEEDGLAHRVAGGHRDPERAEVLDEFMAEPLSMASGAPVAEVLRSGASSLLPTIDDEVLRAVAGGDEAQLERLRQLGTDSGIVVAMVARGRTLGAFTLVSARP